MKKIIVTAILATFIASCQSDDSQPADGGDHTIPVGFTLIGDGELMENESIPASNLVIDNETDWNALKTQLDLHNPHSQDLTETTIDFSEFKVIAVIDELRNYGVDDVSTVTVTQTNGQIIVNSHHSDPDPGNAQIVLTQPFHIVKAPQSDLPVIFE